MSELTSDGGFLKGERVYWHLSLTRVIPVTVVRMTDRRVKVRVDPPHVAYSYFPYVKASNLSRHNV